MQRTMNDRMGFSKTRQDKDKVSIAGHSVAPAVTLGVDEQSPSKSAGKEEGRSQRVRLGTACGVSKTRIWSGDAVSGSPSHHLRASPDLAAVYPKPSDSNSAHQRTGPDGMV